MKKETQRLLFAPEYHCLIFIEYKKSLQKKTMFNRVVEQMKDYVHEVHEHVKDPATFVADYILYHNEEDGNGEHTLAQDWTMQHWELCVQTLEGKNNPCLVDGMCL